MKNLLLAFALLIPAEAQAQDLRLRVRTTAPTPLLPNYMSRIFILNAQHEAPTEAFNSGKAMIGTGPYRLAPVNGMGRLDFERKDDYWGGRKYWQHVSTQVIGNDAARLAALLAGHVDVIETVPTQDAARLAKDARVRQAFSKAIDRRALIERLMDGYAVAAGQSVREGQFGYDPGIQPDVYDPEAARRLLAEAGFPHGLTVAMNTTRDPE